jgi:hypothetical protein
MTKKAQILKRLLVTIVLLCIVISMKSQTVDTLKNLPNLLFPKFSWGVVTLKTGVKNKAMLNYNTVTQELVFMQKGKYLILDNPQDIDTVILWNKIFIPFDAAFYELAITGPVTLFIQHKSYVEQPGYPTGYGAKSQTAGPNAVSTIYSASGPINLKLPNDYKVFDDTEFWIRKGETMSKFDSKRQFLKIFPDKENELSKFINKKKTDFKSITQVLMLVDYCNELYK